MSDNQQHPFADALITATGIARLAGVGRAAVSNWRRRYADFPAPVSGPLTSPSFNAEEVEEWLIRRGRLAKVGPEQTAWRLIEGYQPVAAIGDVLGLAGAYLLARSARGATDTRLPTPRQLAGRIAAIDRDLADLVRRTLPETWDAQLRSVLRSVDELAQDQDPESIFEYLHRQYLASAQSMAGLAGTAETVVEVMLAIAGPGRVTFDPTCGTGSILRTAADHAARTGTRVRCLAQEINPQYALIAALRLWFVHTRAVKKSEPPAVHVGGSLLADAYPDLHADVVVANFPFGIHDWGHEQLAYDPRWAYGVPPKTEPELAWVQHALSHLTPGGVAVVLMPPAAASRPAGRRVRAELVRRGALRAVVALPAGLMPPAGIGLHIWTLARPSDDQPPADRLLFVDASNADRSLTELVGSAWNDFRLDRYTELVGVHRSVPAIDVLDEHVDVTPQRYTTAIPDVSAMDPNRTLARLAEIDHGLAHLRKLLPTVKKASPRKTTTPRTALADLVRAGTVTLRRTPTRPRPDESTACTVLTTSDIISGRPPTGTAHVHPDDTHVRIGRDDILVSVSGRDMVARVATEHQLKALPEPGIHVVHVDSDRFDPWFIAAVLPGSRTTVSKSGSSRTDLRRITIPVIPLADQRRIGRAFQQLTEFRTGLEHLAALGADVSTALVAGLVTGALTA